MSISLILLLLLVAIIGISSFIFLNLNKAIVSLDLLFFQIDFPLGVIVLTVFCLGILTTIILEVLYFSPSTKRSD
jgi:uncharacterized integral membrane protein